MGYYVTAYKKCNVSYTNMSIEDIIKVKESVRGQKVTFITETLYSVFQMPCPPVLRYGECSRVPDDISTWYTTFRIPKRSGGYREIKAPIDSLKIAQRAILRHMQNQAKILEHQAAYGFVKHRNCKQALEIHKANHSRWFLKLDFHNFFPSFTADILVEQLRKNAAIHYYSPATVAEIIHYCTDSDNKLVQGAPTSPYLANIAMIPFDHALQNYCREQHLVYTRYADDILISGRKSFDWRAVRHTVNVLLETHGYTGFTLAQDKTRYGNFNGANWNLGMMYNNNFDITVGHEAKHTMKVIAHKWNTLSEEDKQHWKGVFAYYKYIEPEYFSQERFNVIQN